VSGLIRVGIDEASVARAVQTMTDLAMEAAEDAARIAARRVADRMEAETLKTDFGFKDPTGEYVGSIVSSVEKTGDGWRAFLTVEGDDDDIIKARIIEYGRGAKFIYPGIVTGKSDKKAMKWIDPARSKFKSGPNTGKVFAQQVRMRPVEGKHVLLKIRDRVYQRIRRGTV